MKSRKYFALFLCVITLAACQTMRGVEEDIGSIGSSASLSADQDSSQKLIGSCPVVEIVQDLAVYSDFAPPGETAPGDLVSSVGMSRSATSCAANKRSVTVDIQLAFDAVLGPRGRMSAGAKPFFTYPYFVAVTDPSGKIMAKEIFAASFSFEAGEEQHHHQETLRHIIPLENPANVSNYRVLIGFQLTPDQLEYNRAAIAQAKAQSVASARAAMDAKVQALKNGGGSSEETPPAETAPVEQETLPEEQAQPAQSAPVDLTAPR